MIFKGLSNPNHSVILQSAVLRSFCSVLPSGRDPHLEGILSVRLYHGRSATSDVL